MARLMLSAGMFSALAAATAPRRRGLASASPPPWRAAMVISLIRRVNILPRLASSAPFLCLIVAHFEWPDMKNLSADNDMRVRALDRRGKPNPTEYTTARDHQGYNRSGRSRRQNRCGMAI